MSLNPCLPADIVVEILSRSSVKSLMRFKCVSRAWLSFISDPDCLPILHLNQAKFNTSYRNHKIILHSHGGVQCLEYSTTSNFGESKLINLEFDPITKPTNFWDRSRQVSGGGVIGSCNGLVCIFIVTFPFDYKRMDVENIFFIDFFIWNPSTRACRMLQTNPNLSGSKLHMYGFGYDLSTQDYKLVVGTYNDDAHMVSIFACKTNHWRQIEVNWPHEFVPDCCHYVNGNLYWLAANLENGLKKFIITFDLAKEKFDTEMALPNVDVLEDDCLGVLGECQLCLHCRQRRNNHFEFWVMKEYGVWEKLRRIDVALEDNIQWFTGFGEEDEVMCLCRDKRLLEDNWDLVKSYDIVKGRTPERFNITKTCSWHQAIRCLETLISPN